MDLHRGSTSVKEMKRLADSSFGDKLLKSKNDLLDTEAAKNTKNIDNQSKFKPKRSIRTADLIVTVIADVGADH